jgi:hypothetical protein
MATVWDKTLYDAAYSFNAEPDGHPNTRPAITLHYHRYVLFPEMLRRAQFFISHFGLTSSSRVLVVGCGFGWTVEALNSLGIPTIGTDVSAYIQGNKSLTEDSDIDGAIRAVGLDPTNGEGLGHFNRLRGGGVRTTATVLNEDSGNNASRNRVKNAIGSDPTLIITEDIVTSLTDAECATLQSNIVKYGVTVPICHFLTEFANPAPPFNFNSKSITEWKALFPTATIIADGYVYRVA